MSKADQFRQYADEAMGIPIQNQRRERNPSRSCVHMDASGSVERGGVWPRTVRKWRQTANLD
jgi:hypothetical protein